MTNDPPISPHPTTAAQRVIADEVADERRRQRQQWSKTHDERHSVGMWIAILGARMGRLCSDALSHTWSPAAAHPDALNDAERALLRHRAVQVAAVASALAEQLAPREP